MTMRLELAIGPVQGFVAQSRRTRDLWGSSYLLSFLSAHAIRGAEQAGARIVVPKVAKDPMMRWVNGVREGGPPRIGSVPNQFAAEVDGDPAEVARAAGRAFEEAWRRVCNAVWEKYVEHAWDRGDETREIWERQTGSFWEIAWAAGPGDATGLLARRKYWRYRALPPEPGDKCTVMPEYQEISGWVRTRSPEDGERQEKFWDDVRSRAGALDLRSDERLCAVALVKRLFARVSEEALGWEVNRAGWPSIVYIAAVPWIREVLEHAEAEAESYADLLNRWLQPESLQRERIDPFRGLTYGGAGGFASFDATVFHKNLVDDEETVPLEPSGDREALKKALGRLYEATTPGKRKIGAPPVFYALLLADGDRLGRLVATRGPDAVGDALSRFTASVQGIVRDHDGVTVYAGGDDVLALLPVENALACAAALRERYAASFEDAASDGATPTLSAAVVFAHMRLALSSVIAVAHRLLDEIAKDGNGRDSLAVAVLKRGGLNAQWVSAWTRPGRGDGAGQRAVAAMETLRNHLEGVEGEAGVSSSLLYRLREALGLLCGWPRWEPGEWGEISPDMDVEAFVRAEILQSLRPDGKDGEGIAGRLAGAVVELLHRVPGGPDGARRDARRIGVDGLLIARFLARKGREEAE